MTSIITLDELCDEPTDGSPPFSRRLLAVLERLPVRTLTGTPTRIRAALWNANLCTVAKLLSTTTPDLRRARHFGPVFIANIDEALAHFGLYRVDVHSPVIVDDALTRTRVPALLGWIKDRMATTAKVEKALGAAASAHQITEGEVLADVLCILAGNEPTNRRSAEMRADGAPEHDGAVCCRRCEQASLGDAWPFKRTFIVCPDCGNKRCPKATQHDNACTRSNASGQPGSDY